MKTNPNTQWIPLLLFVVTTLLSAPATASSRYDSLINKHANRTGIPATLIKEVIRQESSFNRKARSPKGALGLMQLMPPTARRYGVKSRTNPDQNIRGGTDYMKWLYTRYKDWRLVLAAYNAGEGAVDKHNGIPPYKETQNYVRKILTKWQSRTDRATPMTMIRPDLNNQPKAISIQKQGLHSALTAATAVSWQPPKNYYFKEYRQ